MKLYCPTCGSGTNYSLDKPKFCASCGQPFTISSSTTPGKVSKPKPEDIRAKVEEIEEIEEEFEMPQIEKLQYHLEASQEFNAVPLGNIAGTNEGGESDGYVREADPTYTTESLNEDFRRDAGSSRTADAET